MKEVERRIVECEMRVERREDGKVAIVGYPIVFGKQSVDLGGFVEIVKRGATKESITSDDIRGLRNHNPDMLLGRNKSGTMKLKEDKTGLLMEIEVGESSIAQDTVNMIERGDMDGGSFSFRTIDDQWNVKDEVHLRTLLKVRLFDVGPVVFPAYPDTAIGLRSLEAWKESLNKPDERELARSVLQEHELSLREQHVHSLLGVR